MMQLVSLFLLVLISGYSHIQSEMRRSAKQIKVTDIDATRTTALTEEEIKAEFTKLVMKCLKNHPVDMTELTNLQKLLVPKKTEVKCLLACAYKMDGIMTAKGLYDLEHAYKVAELSKNGDEKRLENGRKMADECVKVNDVAVSDGEKGCERAGLMFKCAIENAPKFGFKL